MLLFPLNEPALVEICSLQLIEYGTLAMNGALWGVRGTGLCPMMLTV